MENLRDLAIIGAGPAGIATAVESVILGIKNVILFEKGADHSETIRRYFDDRKPVDRDWKGIRVDLKGNINFEDGTKDDTINMFEQYLQEHLIDAKFSTEVVSITRESESFKLLTNTNESYHAKCVILAIGKMGKPNKPDYDLPKTLKKQINFNIADCTGDEDVLVVGGGDTATEFAYFIHSDNRVTFSYRKDEITRANPKNTKNLLDTANDGKINLKLGVDIVSVSDEDGKCKVDFTDGSSEVYDRIIYGLGGSTPKEFLANTPVLVNEKGKPTVEENHLNSKGIYLAGDIAGDKGGSIALALNHGYDIIQDVIKSNESCKTDVCFVP